MPPERLPRPLGDEDGDDAAAASAAGGDAFDPTAEGGKCMLRQELTRRKKYIMALAFVLLLSVQHITISIYRQGYYYYYYYCKCTPYRVNFILVVSPSNISRQCICHSLLNGNGSFRATFTRKPRRPAVIQNVSILTIDWPTLLLVK